MIDHADFYLTSRECTIFAPVRACKILRILRHNEIESYMLEVEISPPVRRELLEVNDRISIILMEPHYKNDKIDQIEKFPFHVRIAFPTKNISQNDKISFDDYEIVAWGELIKNKEDVEAEPYAYYQAMAKKEREKEVRKEENKRKQQEKQALLKSSKGKVISEKLPNGNGIDAGT